MEDEVTETTDAEDGNESGESATPATSESFTRRPDGRRSVVRARVRSTAWDAGGERCSRRVEAYTVAVLGTAARRASGAEGRSGRRRG